MLEQTFPFIGFPELRDIPLSVLTRMAHIPLAFLKELAAKSELYEICPLPVKQQIWQINQSLFVDSLIPLLAEYTSNPELHSVAAYELTYDASFPPPPPTKR